MAPLLEQMSHALKAASAAAPPSAAPPSALLEQPPPITPEQRAFELQQRFERDLPPDSRAHAIGAEVRNELERALGTDGRLAGVDCKRTTCRAALGFSSMAEDRALFQKILAAAEGPFASFEMRADRQIAPDGQVTTVLFFYL
jgi:hypothetical protein